MINLKCEPSSKIFAEALVVNCWKLQYWLGSAAS